MTGLPWQDQLAGCLAFLTCIAVIAAAATLGARSFGVLWAGCVTLLTLAAWRLN